MSMSAQPNLGMQVTTFDNPMGIDGFEFVEFAAPAGQGDLLRDYFTRMGFSPVLQHKNRPITVYRQGEVNFLLNEDPDSFAADFRARTWPERCGFGIRFRKPTDEVCKAVIANGGEAIDHKPETRAVDAPIVQGHRRLHAVPGRPRGTRTSTRITCRCRAPTRIRRDSA
jgi:4-hydroxyphenylpyruvate dioxygenase